MFWALAGKVIENLSSQPSDQASDLPEGGWGGWWAKPWGMGGGGPPTRKVGAPWAVGVGVAYLGWAGARDELSHWLATSGSCTVLGLWHVACVGILTEVHDGSIGKIDCWRSRDGHNAAVLGFGIFAWTSWWKLRSPDRSWLKRCGGNSDWQSGGSGSRYPTQAGCGSTHPRGGCCCRE